MLRVICAMFCLIGCTSLDATTLARLSQVNPLGADPALFRVLANLPEGLAMREGQSQLVLTLTTEGETEIGEFVLEQGRQQGQQMLAVAEQDLDRLRALQVKAREAEAQDPDGTKGSLSASVGLCSLGEGPDPDDQISIDLVMDGETAMPLVRALSVEKYLSILKKQGGEALQPCP